MTKTVNYNDAEGRIKAATISTNNLKDACQSYIDCFSYVIKEESDVDYAQAASWGTPKMVGKKQVVMGPSSGADIYIRFVENDPIETYEYLKTYGWNAIEITVSDVEKLNDDLKNSPFKIIGKPAKFEFTDVIYPMQAVGISDEVLYLNEVSGDLPDYDLPIAQSFVDHIFIMILATPNVDEAVDFYADNIGWDKGETYELPYSMINNAFGLAKETKSRLSMTCVGRTVNNEIDQYPENTIVRPRNDGMLEPGIALATFMVEDLDKVAVNLISEPIRQEKEPYKGRRSACCIGAAGELIELIEIN